MKSSLYFGAITAAANRIAKGRFTLDGTTHKLAVNNGPNALHGGLKGFDRVVWQAEPSADTSGASRAAVHQRRRRGRLSRTRATVTYADGPERARDRYQATTDATPINLTNHCTSIAGGVQTVLGHAMTIDATATSRSTRRSSRRVIGAVAGDAIGSVNRPPWGPNRQPTHN